MLPHIHLERDSLVRVHRVVPLRFARLYGGTGPVQQDAPDLDDRGFLPAAGWTRGPAMGVWWDPKGLESQDPWFAVSLIRDRLDRSARLYASAKDPIVELTQVLPGDVLRIRAKRNRSGMTRLRIHHGSPTGPVLAEMTILVRELLHIRVQVHLVTLGGQRTSRAERSIEPLFRRVNAILEQSGIRCDLVTPCKSPQIPHPRGEVLIDKEANRPLFEVLSHKPHAGALNLYFVSGVIDPKGKKALGFSISQRVAMRAHKLSFRPKFVPLMKGHPGFRVGLVVADIPDPQLDETTVAHEIGHALGLEHYAGRNKDAIVIEIWACRNLMFNWGNWAPGSIREIGYGSQPGEGMVYSGQAIGCKPIPHLRQADQVKVIRDAVLSRNYVPSLPRP